LQLLLELGDLWRKAYLQRRFGRLLSLQILRVEVSDRSAECECLMRAECTWDRDRPPAERLRNASLQAIEDALALRNLIFFVLPKVKSATVRVYRRAPENQLEPVIIGTVHRNAKAGRRVRSIAMKAKLCGLRFQLSEEGLEVMQTNDWGGGSAPELSEMSEISIHGGSSNGR
jgi:hypothetical protein